MKLSAAVLVISCLTTVSTFAASTFFVSTVGATTCGCSCTTDVCANNSLLVSTFGATFSSKVTTLYTKFVLSSKYAFRCASVSSTFACVDSSFESTRLQSSNSFLKLL